MSHLKFALKKIWSIKPWFSKEFNAWIFSNTLYPLEYAGDTKEEVIQNYPLYIKEFIKHRLQDKLSPLMEKNQRTWRKKVKSCMVKERDMAAKEIVYVRTKCS